MRVITSPALCAWVLGLGLVGYGYALPAGLNVYLGSHYDGTERTLYRDGVTPLPGSSVLQPVLTIDGVNDGVWTNPAANYLYGNDVLYTQQQAATTMGSDPLGGKYADGSGEWNMAVVGGDTVLGGNIYYVRIFSSSTITGAAYYADTKYLTGTNPNTDYGDFTDMYVNVVNPAYVIPGFGVVFPTNGHLEADSLLIGYGDVGTTPAGGNNQLADSMVSVRWENVTLGTSGYVAVNSGTWLVGEIPIEVASPDPATNIVKFIAIGISPREGLPVGQEETRYVLGLPEPAGLVIMTLGLFAFCGRGHK